MPDPRTIPELFRQAVSRYHCRPIMMYKAGGEYVSIPAPEFREEVDLAAHGLIDLGVGPGTRVALLSENRPGWAFADLAALSVAAHGLHPIEPRRAWPLRPGQWVVALGHPWGVTGAATAGIVIDLGKPPEMPRFPGELLQVSLHLRPGHSGGPLVDEHGHLVGLNTMMAGPDVGLAIPLPAVTDFLKKTLRGLG